MAAMSAAAASLAGIRFGWYMDVCAEVDHQTAHPGEAERVRYVARSASSCISLLDAPAPQRRLAAMAGMSAAAASLAGIRFGQYIDVCAEVDHQAAHPGEAERVRYIGRRVVICISLLDGSHPDAVSPRWLS